MLQCFIDEKSTQIQVMVLCCQAPSHYQNQCSPRSIIPYGPRWVNNILDPETRSKWNLNWNFFFQWNTPEAHLESWLLHDKGINSLWSNNTLRNQWSWSTLNHLTHWGRVMHICVGNLTIIGSDNGLSPGRRQAIIWSNDRILLMVPLGTNFSEILIEIQTFSFKIMRFVRPFCLGLNVLMACCLHGTMPTIAKPLMTVIPSYPIYLWYIPTKF